MHPSKAHGGDGNDGMIQRTRTQEPARHAPFVVKGTSPPAFHACIQSLHAPQGALATRPCRDACQG
jgi:hypothetical protein